MHRRTFLQSTCAAALAPCVAWAQAPWPSRPVTYVVPFPPGGTTDILARLIGSKLGAALNTTFVVDYRAGAGGGIGSKMVAGAPADGYTLIGGTVGSHAINPSVYPSAGYDPVRSFAPIALIGVNPLLLVVSEKSRFHTLQDVLAAARRRPDTITSASAGNGTSPHLAVELLGMQSGAKFVHVPYKGSGPATLGAIAGHVDMAFETTVVAGPHVQSGKLRALAVTSAKRLETLPDVPTVAEAVPGFEVIAWQGIFAPAGTPRPIIERLNAEVMKILKTDELQDRLRTLGMQFVPMSADAFRQFQTTEVEKWARVVKAANIKLE